MKLLIINILLIFSINIFSQDLESQELEENFDNFRAELLSYIQIRREKANEIKEKAFNIHKQMIDNPKYYYCQTGYRKLGKNSKISFGIPFGIGINKACRESIILGVQISEHFLEETIALYNNALIEIKRLAKYSKQWSEKLSNEIWNSQTIDHNKKKILWALELFNFKIDHLNTKQCLTSTTRINKKETLSFKYCLSDFTKKRLEKKSIYAYEEFLKAQTILRLLDNASLNSPGFIYGFNTEKEDQRLIDAFYF